MSKHSCGCSHDKNHEHKCHTNEVRHEETKNSCGCGCGHGKDNKPNPKSATNNQWC